MIKNFSSHQYWVWSPNNTSTTPLEWSEHGSKYYEKHKGINQLLFKQEIEWEWPSPKLGWTLTTTQTNNNKKNILTLLIPVQNEIPLLWKQISEQLPFTYNNTNTTTTTSSSSQKVYQVGLKLSNLQKAIRRRETSIALRTTWNLLQSPESTLKLLRRLPIIIVEDAILHPRFDALVFLLLIVTKGWKLDPIQQTFILYLVQTICAENIPADYRCGLPKDLSIPFLIDQKEEEEEGTSLLFSLLMRARYGGMKGDMQLLYETFTLWNVRFLKRKEKEEEKQNFNLSCWKIESLSTFRWEILEKGWNFRKERDQIPEAVDFHCSNIVLFWLKKYNIPISESETLKGLVWKYRSSIYKRKCICGLHNTTSSKEEDISLLPSWWKLILQEANQDCLNYWNKPYLFKEEEETKKSMSRKRIQEQQLHSLHKKRTQSTLTNYFSSSSTNK